MPDYPISCRRGAKRLRIALLADASHANTEQWCLGLEHAGAEVHVISFGGNVSSATKTHLLPPQLARNKINYVLAVPFVRRLLKIIAPDVLACYYVTGHGLLGALTGFRPIVQITAGSDILRAPRNRLLRRLIRFTLQNADLVTAWAPHLAAAAIECGASSVFVKPRGIPLKRFMPYQPTRAAPGEPFRLISTRSLWPRYGIDNIIAAMGILKRTERQAQLTISGTGPSRDELEKQAASLGLGDCIDFVGYTRNVDLPQLLAQHEIYISAIPWDGVSASLLEAMAVGLIPVVPDNDANRHWVRSGVDGILLPEMEPEQIAEGILAARVLSQQVGARKLGLARLQEEADSFNNAESYVQRFAELVR